MSVQERKARERADRERLIVATARELAEQQGWDAVTTRRTGAEAVCRACAFLCLHRQSWTPPHRD
jgi:DNA-binding transcriptional regulator YbjK